jgi:hypothetical protein
MTKCVYTYMHPSAVMPILAAIAAQSWSGEWASYASMVVFELVQVRIILNSLSNRVHSSGRCLHQSRLHQSTNFVQNGPGIHTFYRAHLMQSMVVFELVQVRHTARDVIRCSNVTSVYVSEL